MSLEELVNVHQYDMVSGPDSQLLESPLNGHASYLEVGVLKVLNGGQITGVMVMLLTSR